MARALKETLHGVIYDEAKLSTVLFSRTTYKYGPVSTDSWKSPYDLLDLSLKGIIWLYDPLCH